MIGSIVDYRYAPDDPEAVIELLAAPSTRIVSLTITEGGYNIDERRPRRRNVSVWSPRRWPGAANAASRRRRSCPATTSRATATSPARRSPPTPSGPSRPGRVDGRTHQVPQLDGRPDHPGHHARRHRRRWQTEFGVDDQWPVAAEPFTSWVLEDDFSDGRPPLEEVGVLMVDDVTPYELMKLRLLNASHQGLCYFAYLAGYRLVHDAAGDPLFAEFLLDYMDSEATPTLQAGARHRPARLQAHADRAVRQPRRARHHRAAVLRLVRPHPEVAAAGDPGEPATPVHPIRLSAATVASWARYAEGIDEQGEPIDVQDQLADTLVPLAKSQRENPTAFIENTAVFGDLAERAPVRRGLPVGAGLAAPRRCARDTGDSCFGRTRHERAADERSTAQEPWSSVRR